MERRLDLATPWRQQGFHVRLDVEEVDVDKLKQMVHVKDEDIEKLETDPGAVRAKAYDLVLNGSEIGGGSIRNHRSDIQLKILDLLGINKEQAQAKFGFLLEALEYGAPPHGGIALGLDRIVAILAAESSIREVIAFPKTQTAFCPLTEAPTPVSEQQLKDLHIRLRPAVTSG